MNKNICHYLKLFFLVFGPGFVVMLADTDAGSIITAAQTGAVWGYQMLSLQLVLIPILYVTQELTVRLGITTGMGHAELIKKHFGLGWAWFSVLTLLICCVGAIITQFVGLVGVGLLFGVAPWVMVLLTIIFLIVIAITGSYQQVEYCAIFIGLFEIVFIVVAYLAHPSLHDITAGLKSFPITNPKYLYLMAANIGAVVMPWMIFYQQSAIVDKKLTPDHFKMARFDTAIGAVITQAIMIAVIVTLAATLGKTHQGHALTTVQQISHALTPFLGETVGKLLFALGMIGASLIALIVVSLTVAWSIGEIMGYKHSLEHHPKEAPWFYSFYILILVLGGLLVLSGVHLVELSVAIEVLNALLLPIVLGFLFLLAIKTLPAPYRLKGVYAWVVGIVLAFTSLFAVISGIWGSL